MNEGDVAPDFELPNQDGIPVSLSGLRGRKVVLYFYPRADTPGCTTQACGVRDHLPDYERADAVVLGVSPDPVEAVKRFHDKQGLNFTLLADEDHAVAERYGVWVEKSRYGKTSWGVERTTFLLDEDGRVTRVLRRVKPDEHDRLVLDALGAAA
jgi:thioredoxin-dependent peroxiredoxin